VSGDNTNVSVTMEAWQSPGVGSVPLVVQEASPEKQDNDRSATSNPAAPSQPDPVIPEGKFVTKSNLSDMVCFNVGGKKFYCMRENFLKLPTTRLGLLAQCEDSIEILKLCDRYFEGDIPEFFFDRSWKGFNDILDVYRLGRLHLNAGGLCPIRARASIEFWQIDELMLDPCCALKYYPSIEECEKESESQKDIERSYVKRLKDEDFGNTTLGRLRKFCWNLTEYPETSLAARLYAFTSMGVVVISTIVFVLSTMPELTDDIDMILLYSNTTEGQPPERWEKGIVALAVLDHLTMAFFTIEFLTRFTCAPKKCQFLKSALNIIDLLAILPYYFGFVLEGMKDTLVVGRVGKVLRLVRVMRILRVFKLVRHFNGLQSLLITLGQAYKELGLLMCLLFVCVLTFASLIYFAERDSVTSWSFPESFWWGLMVLTTVGIGDKSPDSWAGQIIGGLCALMAVFILALPVPIIVNSFSENYNNRVWKNQILSKKKERNMLDFETEEKALEKDSEKLKSNKIAPEKLTIVEE